MAQLLVKQLTVIKLLEASLERALKKSKDLSQLQIAIAHTLADCVSFKAELEDLIANNDDDPGFALEVTAFLQSIYRD